MSGISQNKYLNEYNNGNSLSLYSFLYDEGVAPQLGSHEDIVNSVYNLLAILHFKTFLSGYRYLAKLIILYVSDESFDREAAVARIANEYGVSERTVTNNVTECLQLNRRFAQRTSLLLKIPTDTSSIDIDDAVELIGALYTVYCNYITDEQ